jgi:hypothetical protein
MLFRFGRSIADLISTLTEFSVKGAGFEASGKRKIEAAAALGAALAKPQDGPAGSGSTDPRLASRIVESVSSRVLRQANKSRVLWVDDKPTNNVHERRSLEPFGITFALAQSTEDALHKIRDQSFDAIISDMSRPGDSNAA